MKRNILFGINILLFVATYAIVMLAAMKKIEFPDFLLKGAAGIVVIQQATAMIALFRSTNFFSIDNELNTDGWDLLATLWKFQKKYCGTDAKKRWCMTVSPLSADFPDFASGFARARKFGYVNISPESLRIELSSNGYQFCKQNEQKLNKRNRLFFVET